MPAVSPGHMSRGLQRPQEPPWPGDWGLGAGGGPLLGENQAEGPTPPHPSIQLRCTPAGLAHLVPAREPQKSPSPREWGCQAPVPLPLQAEVTSRGQNLQPGPLPWYPGSLDAHRPPSPTTSAPSPRPRRTVSWKVFTTALALLASSSTMACCKAWS